MSFKVFPDPPTAPLQLNAGATSGAFTLPPTPALAQGDPLENVLHPNRHAGSGSGVVE